MSKEQVLGIVRAVLAYAGGFASSHGYFDSATADAIVGAGLAIAAAVWSVLSKRA